MATPLCSGGKTDAVMILSNFLQALAVVIDFGLTLFMWVVIAQAVLSWVNPDPFNPIVRFVNQVTEPVLRQIRMRIPTVYGGIDLSPIIVILAIVFFKRFVVMSLIDIARNLSYHHTSARML